MRRPASAGGGAFPDLTRSRVSTAAPASNSLFTSWLWPFRQAQCKALRCSWRWRRRVSRATGPPLAVPPHPHSQSWCPEGSYLLLNQQRAPPSWLRRPQDLCPINGKALCSLGCTGAPAGTPAMLGCSPIALPRYLVVGIGVPSVRQVLVNQGLLVLSRCLQECLQAHGLWLGLGLGLGKLRTRANQLHTVGCRDIRHRFTGHTKWSPQRHCWLVQMTVFKN